MIALVGGGILLVHKAKQAGFDAELMRNNPGLATAKLLVATNPRLDTIVIGIVKMISVETETDWSAAMATAMLALIPPVVVVVVMQRWFVAGLTEGEK